MENFELIEKYLLDQMTVEEKTLFEKRLEQEPELKQEKESLATMILGVESLHLKESLKGRKIGDARAKNQTPSISNDPNESLPSGNVIDMKPQSSFSMQKLAIAASFIALCICGWWLLSPNAGTSDIDQLFGTDPGLPTPMSETTNYNFYDGMVEYKMENYSKALKQWNNAQGTIGSDTLNYYMGMALLKQDKLQAAADKLSAVKEGSALSDKAQWYQLNILIKEKKFAAAKSLIQSMSPSSHSKYEEVRNYLEEK